VILSLMKDRVANLTAAYCQNSDRSSLCLIVFWSAATVGLWTAAVRALARAPHERLGRATDARIGPDGRGALTAMPVRASKPVGLEKENSAASTRFAGPVSLSVEKGARAP